MNIAKFLRTYGKCFYSYPFSIYFFIANNRNTTKRCEICSNLTIKTPQQLHGAILAFFAVNFEHISHLFLVLLLLPLNN